MSRRSRRTSLSPGGSFEGLGRTAIDDPVVLGIGAVCTACFGVVAFFRIRAYRCLRPPENTIHTEVNGVKRVGEKATTSFRDEHVNRGYATGETVPAEAMRASQKIGRNRHPIESRSSRRGVVQQLGRRAPQGQGKTGRETSLSTSDAAEVARMRNDAEVLLKLLEEGAKFVSRYSSMSIYCGHFTGAEFAVELRSLAERVSRQDWSALSPLNGIFAPTGRWDDEVGLDDDMNRADRIMALLVALGCERSS